MTGEAPVLVEKRPDGIAVVTLNNPPLNLRSMESTFVMEKTAKDLDADDMVRVVVICGKEGSKAFSAGSDIKEFPVLREKGNFIEDKVRRENAMFTRFERLTKPVIAAINAIALGGGYELALACDMRVIDETARIALPEINLAGFPAGGGVIRLVKLIGYSRAMEMVTTGMQLDAQKALEWGLVNRIAPKGESLALALELAFELSRKSLPVMRCVKRLMLAAVDQSIDEGIEASIRGFEGISDCPDAVEGTKAFFEKRPPVFAGAPERMQGRTS